MAVVILLEALLLLLSIHSSGAYTQRRRLLHQPFFPLESSLSPAWSPQPHPHPQPQPQPQQQPKLPFSSSSSSSAPPERPFFPSYRTPSPPLPPPSPTALTSFPANISSLMLPHTSSHSNHHILAVAVAVSASLLSAALIDALAALFLFFPRRRDLHAVGADQDDKASRSDILRLYPPNTATSDGKSRAATLNHSSEFLCLGTLVNSRGGVDHDKATSASASAAANSSDAGIKIGVSASPNQKLG